MVRLFISCALFLLFFGCSHEQPKPADLAKSSGRSPLPMTTITIPEFKGKDAFAFLLRQTSFGPRNPNSGGHAACLQYLATTLRGLADTVRLQEFTHAGYAGEQLDLTNVIASFHPERPDRILLCAHWDTRPRAEHDPDKALRNTPIIGANDGASGVAVLLELATLMKREPPPIGVDLVLLDGEDYGNEGDTGMYLLGSRYFSAHKDAGYDPRFGILLDMIGDTYLEIPREQHSLRYAPDIVDLVWNKAHELGVTQFVDATGEEIIDDHLPLNQAGIKTIDLIDFDYPDPSNRYWHTHQDTPDHCSAESLEAVGTVITNVLYTIQP